MRVHFTLGGWLPATSFPNEYVLVLCTDEAIPELTPIAEIKGHHHYYAMLVVDDTFKRQYAAGGVPLNYEYSDIADFLEPFSPHMTAQVSEIVSSMNLQEYTSVPTAIYEAVRIAFNSHS
jgi:hypothetical protein